MIQQPLSTSAVEISQGGAYGRRAAIRVCQPLGDMPMNRKVMAVALRGTKQRARSRRPASARCSVCARHAARSAPHSGDTWLAISALMMRGSRSVLITAASKKQEQAVPSVTGKVYNHSKRMKEKRAVLNGVAAELRRIIRGSPTNQLLAA